MKSVMHLRKPQLCNYFLKISDVHKSKLREFKLIFEMVAINMECGGYNSNLDSQKAAWLG